MEKLNGTSSPTFAVDDFSRLFLHPFIFSIKDSRSVKIIKAVLSDLWYWLNSKILVSSEVLQHHKNLVFLSDNFLCESSLFLTLK